MTTSTGTESALWLRRFRPNPAATRRLVCFPHAGGSASFYRPVALAHSTDADVVVLQYPGRQDRHQEPGILSIDEYADRITRVLAAEPAKPTVFFGHSMGAVIAAEVARRLEGTQYAPGVLIVSGRRAPGTERPQERIHERDDDGVLAELKRLDGTEGSLLDNEEILRMSLPAIRSDYQAIETYPARPDLIVGCAIVALLGEDDPKATPPEVERWRDHTTAAFRLRLFPGGHFYLTKEQAAVNAELTEALRSLG